MTRGVGLRESGRGARGDGRPRYAAGAESQAINAHETRQAFLDAARQDPRFVRSYLGCLLSLAIGGGRGAGFDALRQRVYRYAGCNSTISVLSSCLRALPIR